MSTRLLLAICNQGKLAELQRLLAAAVPGVEVVGLADVPEYPEAPETGATFEDNALLKAREAVRHTGLVGDPHHRHLGHVSVVGDARHLVGRLHPDYRSFLVAIA